jgi:hypothetical protein
MSDWKTDDLLMVQAKMLTQRYLPPPITLLSEQIFSAFWGGKDAL